MELEAELCACEERADRLEVSLEGAEQASDVLAELSSGYRWQRNELRRTLEEGVFPALKGLEAFGVGTAVREGFEAQVVAAVASPFEGEEWDGTAGEWL